MAEAKRMLEAAVSKPGLGAETEVGQAILKSLELIGKVLPDGAVTPGMQNAGMQQWMMQGRRENPMAAIIAALGPTDAVVTDVGSVKGEIGKRLKNLLKK